MLKRKGPFFALRVKGDSMERAGIVDGDIAVIEKRDIARDGEIVVAVVDEAVTLKRFFKESTRIRLQPENPSYSPIFCQDVRILGRLACLIRTYA
jgi:repressor LexA